MSMSDPVADLLTRIRNGQRAKKNSVVAPGSRIRENVLGVLVREGYIRGFERYNIRTGIDEIKIELKYYDNEPMFQIEEDENADEHVSLEEYFYIFDKCN